MICAVCEEPIGASQPHMVLQVVNPEGFAAVDWRLCMKCGTPAAQAIMPADSGDDLGDLGPLLQAVDKT